MRSDTTKPRLREVCRRSERDGTIRKYSFCQPWIAPMLSNGRASE